MWDNWETMFPKGIAHSDEFQWVSKNLAVEKKLPEITATYIKPARQITDSVIKYTWKENGDFYAEYVYNSYPMKSPDNIPLFNIYGQKIVSKIETET